MKLTIIVLLSLLLPLNAQKRPLRILSHDRPPFHFQDSSDGVVGICVDIVDTIFREMDLPYEISSQNWVRVWYKVEHGEGEAAFSASRKEPRKPFLYYPETDLWTSEFTFFTLRKNRYLAPNGTYDEVVTSGRKVGIWRGASFNSGFWQAFPHTDGATTYDPDKITQGKYNPQLHIVSGPAQAFKMVGMDRLTFCIEDKTVGLYFLKIEEIEGDIVPYEQPVFSKGYPMPFIKNSDYPGIKEIAEEFEERLKEMKEDGRYEEIFKRWLH